MSKITQRTMWAAALLAATTGAALAQAIDPARVAAEAAVANKSGLVARGEVGAPVQHGFTSTQSPAEVRSQAVAAVAAGQTARGELGAPVAMAQSSLNRAEVKAEAAAANKAGLVARGEIGVPAQRGTMPTQMAADVRSQAVAGIAGR